MKFQLKTLTPAQACAEKSDALLVLLPKGDASQAKQDKASKATWPLAQTVQAAQADGDFEDKSGKTLLLYGAAGVAARLAVVMSAGKGSAKDVRDAVAAGMAALKGRSIKKLTVCLGDASQSQYLPIVMQAIADATYVYTATKGSATDDKSGRKLAQVTIGTVDSAKAKAAFAHGQALVAGQDFAKEWANRPANFATPTLLGEAAKSLAKAHAALQCEVLGPKEVDKLGMGSFASVARGSNEPLRFIVLKYMGGAKSLAPTVLIGKGVTFDTGGISLKPGASMDEMKFDMCGAASVLGTLRALAELKPKLNVIGLIPATENMPSGHATKPGDVVTAMDGQTIEVLNTDAEGRLILNDALVYAKRLKPAAVVDIATLTGACGVALGSVRAGLFSTDDALAASLQAAGERALDLAWRMPLDDEYAEGLKSNFADVANIAPPGGGAVTAAKFLERFTKTKGASGEAAFPWAHLDIAGVAWKGGKEKGATARPVGLLLEWLLAK
ncbi:MAG: leucyl aminopeptidase [Cytophagales bacterium]|nr:leucyl aminopeptidase [Cytophagales bacterium]